MKWPAPIPQAKDRPVIEHGRSQSAQQKTTAGNENPYVFKRGRPLQVPLKVTSTWPRMGNMCRRRPNKVWQRDLVPKKIRIRRVTRRCSRGRRLWCKRTQRRTILSTFSGT
eukprot:scaffold7901_cov90-Cylindrotheca_fusiformis.AAC.1